MAPKDEASLSAVHKRAPFSASADSVAAAAAKAVEDDDACSGAVNEAELRLLFGKDKNMCDIKPPSKLEQRDNGFELSARAFDAAIWGVTIAIIIYLARFTGSLSHDELRRSAHAWLPAWSADQWFAVLAVAALYTDNFLPVVYMTATTAAGVLLPLYCWAAGFTFTWTQVVCFPLTVMWLIGVPMSCCLHRFFAHRAYATSRPVALALGVVACLAFQRGPLWWAAKHNRHHMHCDKADDPHSVSQTSFLYAWVGWTVSRCSFTDRDTDRYLHSSFKTPELLALERCQSLVSIGVLYALYRVAGNDVPFAIWSGLMSMVTCRLITLLFNVEFHPKHVPEVCKSVDEPRLLAQIVGESQHADHHLHPRRAHRLDLDFPYFLSIMWLEKAGLIWMRAVDTLPRAHSPPTGTPRARAQRRDVVARPLAVGARACERRGRTLTSRRRAGGGSDARRHARCVCAVRARAARARVLARHARSRRRALRRAHRRARRRRRDVGNSAGRRSNDCRPVN